VAALVEAFMLALVDDRYGLSRYGAHAKNVQTVAEVRARLDAIVAAARAEVDVERLARAMHDGERGTDPTDRPYCDRHRRRLPRDRR
jgi:hypothetical protein